MQGRRQVCGLLVAWVALFAGDSAGQQARLPVAEEQQQVVARANWHRSGRRVPGAAYLRQRAIQQKLRARALRFLSSPAAAISGGWTSVGPLPLPSDASGMGLQDYGWVSGRATAVAIDPNDVTGNTVFVGGAYGGVWKSGNAGGLSPNPDAVIWTPLTDSEATLAIGSIAVQPQAANPDPSRSVVLAGTGETDSSLDSYYGLGILRSPDGGQSWSLVPQDVTGTHSFAGLGFSRIAFSAANPNLVVAGAASASEGILEGLENPAVVNRGIYFSTDAGATWKAASITDAGTTISPGSATSVAYNAAAKKFYAAIRFHGFYSSIDGMNWSRLASQPGNGLTVAACPPQAAQVNTCAIYRGEIAAVPNRAGPAGAGEMYIWYVDAGDTDQGIWKTLDGGATWVQVNGSGITNCGDFFGGCGTQQGAYNLTLAAAPNGTATDLYAGAINLYKCTITNAFPTCNGSGSNTFQNLTHVYGCSDIAKVHPDQHAIDFQISNGAALLFFANDGGIYRALDGFTGLTTGVCGLANQFESLNAALGPMTQFISLSGSATDPNLIFGGSQDNGAPGTGFAQSGGSWVNVNAGDSGFTAVNPANDGEWFLASPPDTASGVNLFRCANGIRCRTQDFHNGQIVSSNTVGGDTGAFYFPFILDQGNSGSLLIGTCRIWRGPATGGTFLLLSPDFENGGTGACSGNETNLVRSLAAGGPKDANGFSQVIYAGTSGQGPLVPLSPHGGHLWVTTNANGGLNTWADRTGIINPLGFPVSEIAIDAADPTGQTAYLTIMGFHTAHVWRTSNAGATWTDFSANLPDAPANAIVLDSGTTASNGTIFVGTDVGVFASATGVANWTEVGPPPGQPGFLPNVAVTSLGLFDSGGLKLLRVATYGRGIWEWNLITTPDFQISLTNNPQTLFAGATAIFHGAVWGRNGYASGVDLSCAPGTTSVPQSCSASPASLLPSPSGTAFAVNAVGTAGDYQFNVHAVGTDPAAVTHDFALTLHVVDFSLSVPSPGAVTVMPGTTSVPISFQLSAAGAFSSTVNLSCGGLPAGAACSFQPSSALAPSSANPIAIAMTVSTLASTPAGISQIAINASTPGGPTRTQTLALTVSAAPDYALSIANPSLTAQVSSPAVFNGTLFSVNGYNNAVTLSCGAGAPPNCAASVASLTPLSGGSGFTLTVASAVPQAYSFNINGVGSDPAAIAHSFPVTFTAVPNQSFDFTLNASPAAASVSTGKSAVFNVSVAPTTATFPSNVNFTCSGLPALTTCAFSPVQIPAGSGTSGVSLTVTTTAPGPPGSASAAALIWLLLPLAGMILMPGGTRRTYRRVRTLAVVLVSLCALSCGGGLQGNDGGSGSGNPGTPKGTYAITITVTSGTVSHSAQVTLTVTK